jgi:hypothetical protein
MAQRIEQVSLEPKKFMGVGSVPDAVEYLHSGKSVGKVPPSNMVTCYCQLYCNLCVFFSEHFQVVVCIDPSYARTTSKL